MSVYQTILANIAQQKKMIVVLLDPDKCVGVVREQVLKSFGTVTPDFIFIGGSNFVVADALIEFGYE